MTEKQVQQLLRPLVRYSGPGILINSYELQGQIRAAQAFMQTNEAAALMLKLLDERDAACGMTPEMRGQPSDNRTGREMEFRARQRYNPIAPPDPEG